MAVAPLPPAVLVPLFFTVALAFSIAFFALASPPGNKPWPPGKAALRVGRRGHEERALVALGFVTLIGHLLQVNIIGPRARLWWLGYTGIDFAAVLHSIEGNFVPSMSIIHWGPLLFVMFWFYLVLHNAFVIIAPIFLALTGERRVFRRLLVSYPILWLIAQVGFFFFPADNPTVHLGLDSVLDRVLPGTDRVFYHGTTISNTIPSLHVGLATLIMLHGLSSRNPRFRWSVIVYAPAVAFSIVYLQIHWALDAVAGAIAALIAYAAGTAIERRLPGRSETFADEETTQA